jgi:hypothetical protein
MGLWVVGRLAGRRGIRVGLRSLNKGVQAEVAIPAALLVPPPSKPYAELAKSVLRRSMTHLLSREMAGVGTASAGGSPAALGAAPAEETVVSGGRAQAATPAHDNSATPRYGPPRPVPAGEPDDQDAANLHSWTREIRLPSQPTGGPGDRLGQLTRGRATAQPSPNGPVVPAPADGGTSGAGLPVRVPMAQLPRNPLAAPPPAPAPGTNSDESDPAEVKAALRRFYRGVHRANPDDTPA